MDKVVTTILSFYKVV